MIDNTHISQNLQSTLSKIRYTENISIVQAAEHILKSMEEVLIRNNQNIESHIRYEINKLRK